MKRIGVGIALLALSLCCLGPPANAQFGSLRGSPISIGNAANGSVYIWAGDGLGGGSVIGPGAPGTLGTADWPIMLGGVDLSGNRQLIPLGLLKQLRVQPEAPGAAVPLLASTTDAVAHTVSNAATVTGLGIYREAQVYLTVTAAAAAVGDTLDVFIDTSPDAGTTWVNSIHYTTVLGNGGAKSFWATLAPQSNVSTTVVAMAGDAASGVVRPAVFTDRLRVRYAIVDGGAHGQSFTFAVLGFFK